MSERASSRIGIRIAWNVKPVDNLPMNFPIDAKKATHAVARLIEKSGGSADYLRVAKLIYLADRKSLLARGIPIVGGHYFSMKRGPTIGEIMDFVQRQNAPDWKATISPRHDNTLRLKALPDFGALSEAEMEILDGIVKEHEGKSTGQLVDWCHTHCKEYEDVPTGKRKDISVESILRAEKRDERKISRVVREAESLAKLDALLA